MHFLEKDRPQCGLQEIVELVIHEANRDAAFAHSDAPDDHHLGLLYHWEMRIII